MLLLEIQFLQFSLSPPIHHAGNSQDELEELKRKQKDEKEGGGEETTLMLGACNTKHWQGGEESPASQRPCSKVSRQSKHGSDQATRKGQGSWGIPQPGSRVGGYTEHFFPSLLARNNKPWHTGIPQLKWLFSANKPQSSRSGSQARNHVLGKFSHTVLPVDFIPWLHHPGLQPEFKNKRAEMVTFFDCMEKEPAELSIWAKNWTALEGVTR